MHERLGSVEEHRIGRDSRDPALEIGEPLAPRLYRRLILTAPEDRGVVRGMQV